MNVHSKAGPKADPDASTRQSEVCEDQLRQYFDALYRYATPGNLVVLRGFTINNKTVREGQARHKFHDMTALVAAALRRAREMATAAPEPDSKTGILGGPVFCPPVCTFRPGGKTGLEDVAEGLDLAAELDDDAQDALARLRDILGTPTIVVRSGGEWADADGELHPKLHAHWRLATPARTKDELRKLAAARALLVDMVKGDETHKPCSHPIRPAGSLHRKNADKPRLAKIEELNPHDEIALDDALTRLRAAQQQRDGIDVFADGAAWAADAERLEGYEVRADPGRLRSALAWIPNPAENPHGDYKRWESMCLALWAATNGSEEGRALFHEWSRKHPEYHAAKTDERWNQATASPPSKTGAGVVFKAAKHRGWREGAPPPPGDEERKTDDTRHSAPDFEARLDDLIRKKGKNGEPGDVLPFMANLAVLLEADPVLRGVVRYCPFSDQTVMMRAPPAFGSHAPPGPYPRPLRKAHATMLYSYLEKRWVKFSLENVQAALDAHAFANHWHPVRNYLDGLQWDGVPRLDTWLPVVFGVEDSPLHRTMGARFLIAAARRIYEPGAKFDFTLVLEGEQGIGKSSAIKALCPDPLWFTDDVKGNLGDESIAKKTVGKWIVEFSELEAILRTGPDNSTTTGYLSRTHDRYRPLWENNYVDWGRQFVIFGTTNRSEYLHDETGNRRYWVVGECMRADVQWVKVNRDQLWAEAVARHRLREVLFIDDAEQQATARQAQEQRVELDAWHSFVAEWLANRDDRLRSDEILTHACGVQRDRLDRKASNRLARIMRLLGWQFIAVRLSKDDVQKRWVRGAKAAPQKQPAQETPPRTSDPAHPLADDEGARGRAGEAKQEGNWRP